MKYYYVETRESLFNGAFNSCYTVRWGVVAAECKEEAEDEILYTWADKRYKEPDAVGIRWAGNRCQIRLVDAEYTVEFEVTNTTEISKEEFEDYMAELRGE